MQIKKTYLIILSFALIYFVWGSTYLFAAFAIEQVPSFRLCGIRYTIASCLTLLLSFYVFSSEWPTRLQIWNACIAGFFFMGLGTGGLIWALNFLDTGLAALIIAGEPMLILLLMWVTDRKRPPNASFFGVLLGLVGMYMLVSQDTLVSSDSEWFGVLAIFLSMLAWGGGSIFVSKASLPSSSWVNSTIQMFVGGMACFVISILISEQGADMSTYTALTFGSIAFLIIFGSVLAFTAFNFLLRNVSTDKVVTNTYVNPIVAMILGYYFNDEIITSRSIVAAILMLSGVFIINFYKRIKKNPS